MANELTVHARMRLVKDGVDMALPREIAGASQSVTITGSEYVHQVQIVGFAAHEALDLGDVGSVGWIIIHNRDATNFIQVGADVTGSFVPVVKLKAGERGCFRLQTANTYLKADTGNCRVEYLLVED